MRDFSKIEAWQLADDLAVAVYGATREFPKEEIYGVTSQIRRAAVSVPANIAEGSGRESKKDYLHFLYIARGSLMETQYLIHLSGRLGYIDGTSLAEVKEHSRRVGRCLHGLISAVESEVGPVRRTVARITSMLVLSFGVTISAMPRS
jgi:four helix bundle protein